LISRIREQAFRAGGGQVAEGWVVEAGRIHGAAAGEFIDDLVDETDLVGGVGAFGQVVGKQLLGGIAIEAYQGADEQPEAVALRTASRLRP
jgi:hypothetical protein